MLVQLQEKRRLARLLPGSLRVLIRPLQLVPPRARHHRRHHRWLSDGLCFVREGVLVFQSTLPPRRLDNDISCLKIVANNMH